MIGFKGRDVIFERRWHPFFGFFFTEQVTRSHPINKPATAFNVTPALSRHPNEDRDLS
jgi:hypothetical protein